MRFSTALALLATPLLALAQNPNPFVIPTSGIQGSAGQTVDLKWDPTTQGTISLYLRSGANSNLVAGVPIAENIPNSGSYTWSIPEDVTRGSDYAVEIRSSSGSNYTPQFVIESSNTVASTTNPVSSASGSATMSVSSATGTSGTASSTGSASTTVTSATTQTTGTATSGRTSSSASGSSSSSRNTASSSSSAGFQSSSSASAQSTGAAPRATAAAGVMGLIAIGAMAL